MNLTWYTACPECGSSMAVEKITVKIIGKDTEYLYRGEHCGWRHTLAGNTTVVSRPEYVVQGKPDPNP